MGVLECFPQLVLESLLVWRRDMHGEQRLACVRRGEATGKIRSALLCLVALAVSLVAAFTPSLAAGQSFDVGTFRPWAGYAIPNGLWMTGDFEGDGRKDIVHAVQNTDYVHVWRSNADGTFAVATFSPWGGYAIPNGLWLTGDFDGDGRTDILHAVRNTDYVHAWLSSGGSQFNVGTFRPWAGYAIPNGVWLTGDFNGDGRTDVFHAVQGTDYAHTWMSRGDGTFKVGTFSPWHGYAIPNGIWLAADINGDGLTDVVHAVQGTDYVHTWISNGDGTFRVGTFRPWPGYAIPNGIWLTGDFNGDGRMDILHAVQNTDYAHVWLSKGNGTFQVSTFRPWPGYAIPNGLWMTGDFNGDGRTDIVHAVNNRSYVHTWISNANGTFTVGTFSPWAGYAIPNGIWLVTDFDDDGKSDIVHAVQNTDYVHTWRSTPPAPAMGAGQVAVEGIESVQSTQDPSHSVTLIADKATFVRVYLSIASGSAPTSVRGTLRVTNAETGAVTTVAAMAAAQLDPARNGNVRAKRENLGFSLNFRLPAGFATRGIRVASLASVRSASTGATVGCSNCGRVVRTLRLATSSHLRLRLVGLSYTTGAPVNPVTRTPTARDFALTESWFRRAMPAAQIISSQTTVNANAAWPFGCGAANTQLATLRATEVGNGQDGRTHYYGLVSDAGGFMRGCAAGIPNAPDPTVVASGPAGANWTGDTDGSYADWYGGHEVGHTFGRFHPGFCGETQDDLTGYPFPAGQLSHNDGNFDGFDAGDPANTIARTVLPGTTSFDVMTYCAQPQWPSAYTYQGIRARLNRENAAFTTNPLAPGNRGAPAPEAGLDSPRPLALPRALFAAAEGASPNTVAADSSDAPPLPALPGKPKTVVGKKLPVVQGAKQKPKPATEFAAAPPLPDAEEQEPGTKGAPPMPEPAMDAPAERNVSQAARATAEPDERTTWNRAVSLRKGKFLSLVATVNLTKGTGQIVSVQQVNRAIVSSEEQDNRATVRVLDTAGAVLAEHRVWLRENTDTPADEDRTAIVDAVVPLVPGASGVELLVDGNVLGRISASKQAPTVSKPRLAKPSSEILTRGVAAAEEQPLTVLRWDAKDADGNPLTYRVELSRDEGRTWEVIALGIRENEYPITLRNLGKSKTVLVRVVASDGWHTMPSAPTKVAR
ncbi:MAG: FG-GAP-like repeat-containing protein [Burkholderiales bacterium]|nr:FG-GAP-like repeat-containing protein [Burkholderiales bacterium]